MKRLLLASIRMALATILITGVVYPLLVWAVGLVAFRAQASGSLIERDGLVVGSRLLGQQFEGDSNFHSRPSAADYDAMASGPTNLGPTNEKLIAEVASRVDEIEKKDGVPHGKVPVDLVTSSASGLDPHISPDSAYLQVGRVAQARGLAEEEVRAIVKRHIEGRQLGVFGELRVNVLELNLALDDL